MSVGAFVVGAGFFAGVFGCAGALTYSILTRRPSHLRGAPRLLAAVLVFTAVLLGVHLLPGILGILDRVTVAVTAVAALVLGRLALGSKGPASDPADDGGSTTWGSVVAAVREDRWGWALVIVGAAAVLVELLAYFRTQATFPVVEGDAMNFHLPVVARWIQSGTLWPVSNFLPYVAPGNYPQNGELVQLAVTLPWHHDELSRFAMLPYLGLMGVGTYALARELRAPATAAALAALALVSLPIVTLAGVQYGNPDALMYGSFAAGLVFVVRHLRSGARSDLVLAAIGLGLALGSKWYGFSCAVVVVAGWAMAQLRRRRPAELLSSLGVMCAVIALAGGFWLLRNAVESGSPFFPAGWNPVGAHPLAAAPGPPIDFTVAHYLTKFSVLRDAIAPQLSRAYGLFGPILLLGLVLAGGICLYRRQIAPHATRPEHARGALFLASLAVALAVVYVVTPDTALGPEGRPFLVFGNSRYLVPAAIPAAAALAWAIGRLPRGQTMALLVPFAGLVDGLRRGYGASAHTLAVGALLLLAAGVVVAALRLARRLSGGTGRPLSHVGLVAAACLLLGALYVQQKRFLEHGHTGLDPTLDYLAAHAKSGASVALTGAFATDGTSPIYPSFGPDLRNRVSYIGTTLHGLQQPYATPTALANGLAQARFDWLVVGTGLTVSTKAHADWARAAGYRVVAKSPYLILMARGSLAEARS